MSDEEKFGGVDNELLEDFEAELADEYHASKKKRNLIFIGIAAGIIIALVLTSENPEPTHVEEITATVEPGKEKPRETPREEPQDIETQIAKLQEQNQIDEDFKAPGALMEDKPLEPAKTIEEPAKPTPVTVEQAAGQTPEDDKKEPEQVERETGPEPEPAPAKATPTSDTARQKPESAAQSVRAVESSPSPETAGTGAFSVQTLATTDAIRALAFRDSLMKKGYDSWISMGKARQELYRVDVGEFKSIRDSSGMSASLGEAGFTTRVKYRDNGSGVTLVAGTFSVRASAEKLHRRIKSAGFPSRITVTKTPVSLYKVRIGKYKTRKEAEQAMASFNNAGIRTLGITR